jgi:hypothetical protein
VVQGPDLLMQCLPAGLALRRAGREMWWGGTDTASAPSDSGTGCGCSVALTASSAWLCVLNTWSRASRRFWSK